MVEEGVFHLTGVLVRPINEGKDMVLIMDLSQAILNHHNMWKERMSMNIMLKHTEQFFPLRDRESPDAEYDQRNALSDYMSANGPPYASQVPPSGGATGYGINQQNWGIYRPNQGVKRSGDQREESEVNGRYDQKRKKT